MDPNKTLSEIRELVSRRATRVLTTGEADELIELIDALDDWMCQGGFLPQGWQRG